MAALDDGLYDVGGEKIAAAQSSRAIVESRTGRGERPHRELGMI